MKINYIDKGKGVPIILIHGWGGSHKSMLPLAEILAESGYRTIVVDLPGFGLSEPPSRALAIDDYVELIKDLIRNLELHKPVIAGHSFGGMIAMFFAAKYPTIIAKIVLINARGINPGKTLRSQLSYFLAKAGNTISYVPPFIFIRPVLRFLFYRIIVRERDYYNAKELKETFKIIVKEYINDKLSNIHCDTLIIWGENDTYTPLWQAKKLESGIKKSRLEVIQNTGHSLPLVHPQIVAELILKFLD